MLRVHLVVGLLVACCVCGEAAYLKAWDDAGGPEQRSSGSPYEQAMLKRLQTYLDEAEDRQREFADAELPVKRQMRYNQCYFNPISCFKRRK